jgi:hypothetical protein
MRCGTRPAKFDLVRSSLGFLIGATFGLVSTTAAAQVPLSPTHPQAAPNPAPPAAAPVPAKAQPAPLPAKAQPAPPVEDPPYDPEQHGGLSYGAYIRATRGTARRSTGMMVTGIVLDVVGATMLASGTGVWVHGNSCHAEFVFSPNGQAQQRCGPMTGHTVGMALMISGLIGLGLGLPLTVYGAAEVPRWEAAGSLDRPIPRASVGFVGYEGSSFGRPGLAGAGTSVTLRF